MSTTEDDSNRATEPNQTLDNRTRRVAVPAAAGSSPVATSRGIRKSPHCLQGASPALWPKGLQARNADGLLGVLPATRGMRPGEQEVQGVFTNSQATGRQTAPEASGDDRSCDCGAVRRLLAPGALAGWSEPGGGGTHGSRTPRTPPRPRVATTTRGPHSPSSSSISGSSSRAVGTADREPDEGRGPEGRRSVQRRRRHVRQGHEGGDVLRAVLVRHVQERRRDPPRIHQPGQLRRPRRGA